MELQDLLSQASTSIIIIWINSGNQISQGFCVQAKRLARAAYILLSSKDLGKPP